jgi:hypothetical protein
MLLFEVCIDFPSEIQLNILKKNHTHTGKKHSHQIVYWLLILLVPSILLIINFSFISDPYKFFSKSGGMNFSDMKKFVIIPGIAVLLAMGYMVYVFSKRQKIRFPRTKVKHIKIKNQDTKIIGENVSPPEN